MPPQVLNLFLTKICFNLGIYLFIFKKWVYSGVLKRHYKPLQDPRPIVAFLKCYYGPGVLKRHYRALRLRL